jgi:calcineurin-like phosphoesterase family protein
MIYFTSDQHYGHQNIIKFCHRPFKDRDEMDEQMIANHNTLVTDEDIVYHLGDFAFIDPPLYLARLKGREHHLILGNHDYNRKTKLYLFTSVQDVLYLRYEGIRFFLSHYAHRTWRNSSHGSFQLYGHSHGNLSEMGRSMDVGVDAHSFCPISIDKVIERLSTRDYMYHHGESNEDQKGSNT